MEKWEEMKKLAAQFLRLLYQAAISAGLVYLLASLVQMFAKVI